MGGVVYDTGALIAAEKENLRIFDVHEVMLRRAQRPVVPAVVLAQAWRGGAHPQMSRLLKGCIVISDDEVVARMAGALCALSHTSDVVDAIVVVTAALRDAAIVTSDPKDLARLLESMGIKLRLHVV